jgi:hypothetical protein
MAYTLVTPYRWQTYIAQPLLYSEYSALLVAGSMVELLTVLFQSALQM